MGKAGYCFVNLRCALEFIRKADFDSFTFDLGESSQYQGMLGENIHLHSRIHA